MKKVIFLAGAFLVMMASGSVAAENQTELKLEISPLACVLDITDTGTTQTTSVEPENCKDIIVPPAQADSGDETLQPAVDILSRPANSYEPNRERSGDEQVKKSGPTELRRTSQIVLIGGIAIGVTVVVDSVLFNFAMSQQLGTGTRTVFRAGGRIAKIVFEKLLRP